MPLTWVGTSVVPSPYQGSRTGKQPEPFPQTGQRSKSYSWKKTNAKQERLLQHSHVWIKKKMQKQMRRAKKHTSRWRVTKQRSIPLLKNLGHSSVMLFRKQITTLSLFWTVGSRFFAGINLLLNKKKSFKGNSLQADSYSNIILVCVPDLQMLPAEHSIMGRGHTA